MNDKIYPQTTLAQRLKKYRVLCGLTQQQVADILNLNRTTYTKYETGVSEPSQEVLKKIVAIFGIDFNSLLGEKDTLQYDFYDSSMPLFHLTRSENELVLAFRTMSPEKKQEFLEMAKDFIATEKKKHSIN